MPSSRAFATPKLSFNSDTSSTLRVHRFSKNEKRRVVVSIRLLHGWKKTAPRSGGPPLIRASCDQSGFLHSCLGGRRTFGKRVPLVHDSQRLCGRVSLTMDSENSRRQSERPLTRRERRHLFSATERNTIASLASSIRLLKRTASALKRSRQCAGSQNASLSN